MPQFINAPKLSVVQAIPASADLDYTGLKSPINVGGEIVKATASILTDYANKSVAIKRKNAITTAKTNVIDQEHQFALNYLTNPNKFTTAEGRKEINDSYNKIIEDRKKLLASYSDQMAPAEYGEIQKAYNQATFNTLYSIQEKSNVGNIKQATDNTVLNLQKIQGALSIAQSDEQKNDLIKDGMRNIKKLGEFGVNTDLLTYNFINQTQSNILDSTINKDIVENIDNEAFFMTNKSGDVMKDDVGNPIIDNSKKIKALRIAHKESLTDASITATAKSLVEFGIPLSEAKIQVKAQREAFWAKNMPKMNATIDRQNEISIDKINKKRVQRDAVLFKNTEDMQSKANEPVSEFLNSIYQEDVGNPHVKLLEKDEKGNTVLSNLTGGQYGTYEEAYKQGKYVKSLSPEHSLAIQELARKENLTTMEGITAFSDGLSATVFDTDSESEQAMNLIDTQNTLHDEVIGTNFLMALAGKDDGISTEIASNILLDAKTGKDIDITADHLNAPFMERADKKLRNKILYNEIINNPSLYRVNESGTTIKTVDDIANRYSRDKEFRSKIDNIAPKIDRLLVRDHRTAIQFDVNKDGYAYNENQTITKKKYQGEFGLPADDKKEEESNYSAIMDNIVSGNMQYKALPKNLQDNPNFNDVLADKYVATYKKKYNTVPTLDELEDLPIELYWNDNINAYLGGENNE